MGEFSKRIGEVGEQIVTDFLELIGWISPVKNFDIPSINPDKHGKNSHGIDSYYHYKSPMISRTIENVLISVKYSKDKYPAYPVSKFKSHYTDLAMAIESFKKSDIRANSLNKNSNFENVFDRGVIFWLNNDEEDKQDLTQKLLVLETPKDFQHDGIFLVDNSKIEFIFSSIEFTKRKFPYAKIEFTYFNSGLNGNSETPKNGSTMPVQYLGSNILPIRVEVDSERNIIVLCCRETFEEGELIRLIGLAKNITANYQSETIIAFPDFNELEHQQVVDNAKQFFEDVSFVTKLTVESFNQNFRN